VKECCACRSGGCFGEQYESFKAALFRKEALYLEVRKKAIVACCFLTKWFAMKSKGPCMEILKSERKPAETGDRFPEERGGMLACDKRNVGCEKKCEKNFTHF
jgi:hypothetical protein